MHPSKVRQATTTLSLSCPPSCASVTSTSRNPHAYRSSPGATLLGSPPTSPRSRPAVVSTPGGPLLRISPPAHLPSPDLCRNGRRHTSPPRLSHRRAHLLAHRSSEVSRSPFLPHRWPSRKAGPLGCAPKLSGLGQADMSQAMRHSSHST
jgi:hypothetical protein